MSAGRKNARGASLPLPRSIFSEESTRSPTSSRSLSSTTESESPSSAWPRPAENHPRSRGSARPGSLPRRRLVLSPGIYNTLCFPSAICLGLSVPSLTLLSRVLFLFNSDPASTVAPRLLSTDHSADARRRRYLSARTLNERNVSSGLGKTFC